MTRAITLSWLLLLVACLLAPAVALAFSVDRRPAVVCVGEALFDCIATERGMTVREMTEKSAFEAFAGGATANVAAACSKLGTPSAWIGCLGADSDGEEMKRILARAGVNLEFVQQSAQPTRRVMVTRNKDTGDREFGDFWKGRSACDFADCDLNAEEFSVEANALLRGSNWLVCGTLGLAYPSSEAAMRRIVESTKESSMKLLVDVNWRPVFWKDSPQSEAEARQIIMEFIQNAHVIKMTDEEVTWLLGIAAEEALSNPEQVHDSFKNAKAVLVTAGEKGASYSMAGCSGFIPPVQVDVVETTGAGDAFTAGFLHQILTLGVNLGNLEESEPNKEARGAICEQIVKFASIVGALTCTGNGAIPAQPLLKDVETFLATS